MCQGWDWDGLFGVKGFIIIESINGLKVLFFEVEYLEKKL